jgi:hypothetical protein
MKKFAAVFIILFLVCTSIPAFARSNECTLNYASHVQPNIVLTQSQRNRLQKSLPYITDVETRQIVERIIEAGPRQRLVHCSDIIRILNDLQITNRHIYSGFLASNGRIKHISSFPGLLWPGFYFGPIIIARWGYWYYDGHLSINGVDISDGQNSGTALLGFGQWEITSPRYSGDFSGYFTLIIVILDNPNP